VIPVKLSLVLKPLLLINDGRILTESITAWNRGKKGKWDKSDTDYIVTNS